MKPMISAAIEFAERAHGDQKYGDRPYRYHLAHVAEVLERFHEDRMNVIKETGIPHEAFLTAAWLHDTLEDTDTTYDELARDFGEPVACLVRAVTNAPGPDALAVAHRTYPKIGETPGATLIKLADRIANVEACIRDNQDKMLEKYRRTFPLMKQYLSADEGRFMWQYLEDIILSGRMPDRYYWQVPCSLCAGNAGSLELLPPGSEERGDTHVFADCWSWLVVSLGYRYQHGVEDSFVEKLKLCLSEGNLRELHRIDEFLIPFYCPSCLQPYCQDHWKLKMNFDPDAPSHYDDTEGICPQGHRRLVDD